MNEEEFKPVNKIVSKNNKGWKLKQAYQIIRINENKITLLLHKLTTYEDIAESNNVILSSAGLIGGSITLRVNKESMDKVIDNFGDIVAKIEHEEGVITKIAAFEEL